MSSILAGIWALRRKAVRPHIAAASSIGLALACITMQPAAANPYYDSYGSPYGRGAYQPYPYYPAYELRPHAPRVIKRSAKPNAEPPLTPTQKQADSELKSRVQDGPLQVMISIDDQSLALYSKGNLIARSKVSTGVPEHPTPTGVFSVIQKRRYHESNIYSGAPMPYMQRLTWSGIAMHQGVVPGRPASHGCIRLPEAFARQLWSITRTGARVIITRKETTPAAFEHARLFAAKAPADKPMASLSSKDAAAPIRSEPPSAERPKGETLRVAEAAPVTSDAPAPEASTKAMSTPGSASESPPAVDAGSSLTVEKPLRAGPVSVFVSRKERKLFVRKGFQPVFEAAVTIDQPDAPIGTHVFTALELKEDGATMRWTAVSLPDRSGEKQAAVARKPGTPPPVAVSAPVVSSAEALERITIPDDARERIAALMSPGASFVISDQGLGWETGLETDFVVVTR